jgi:hypothetical protein
MASLWSPCDKTSLYSRLAEYWMHTQTLLAKDCKRVDNLSLSDTCIRKEIEKSTTNRCMILVRNSWVHWLRGICPNVRKLLTRECSNDPSPRKLGADYTVNETKLEKWVCRNDQFYHVASRNRKLPQERGREAKNNNCGMIFWRPSGTSTLRAWLLSRAPPTLSLVCMPPTNKRKSMAILRPYMDLFPGIAFGHR